MSRLSQFAYTIALLCFCFTSLGSQEWIFEPTKDIKKISGLGDYIEVKFEDHVEIYDTLGVQQYFAKDSILASNLIYSQGYNFVQVRKDNRYGLQELNGDVILPVIYDAIKAISPVLFEISKDGKEAVVNNLNQIVVPFASDVYTSYETDSMVLARVNDIYAYYNARGDSLDYSTAKTSKNPFRKLGIELRMSAENKWGAIKNESDTIVPLIYDRIWQIADDQFLCRKDDLHGVVSSDSIIVPFEHLNFNVQAFGSNTAVIFHGLPTDRKKQFAYLPYRKSIFGEAADAVRIENGNLHLIPNRDKKTQRNIFSNELDKIISTQDSIQLFGSGYMVIYKKEKSDVYNSGGKKIYNVKGSIMASGIDVHILEREGLFGLVNTSGKVIVKPQYKSINNARVDGIFRCRYPKTDPGNLGKSVDHYTIKGEKIDYDSGQIKRIGKTPYFLANQNGAKKVIINESGKKLIDEEFYSVMGLTLMKMHTQPKVYHNGRVLNSNSIDTHLLITRSELGLGLLRMH